MSPASPQEAARPTFAGGAGALTLTRCEKELTVAARALQPPAEDSGGAPSHRIDQTLPCATFLPGWGLIRPIGRMGSHECLF
jgi:hypothetical protein